MSTFQENAKSLFDRSYSAASGFAAKAKIKAQIADQNLQYDTLMRKLGFAVYDELKNDARYHDAFPELFDQIEEVSERRQALEDELARMNEEDGGSQPIDIVPVEVEDSTEKDAE